MNDHDAVRVLRTERLDVVDAEALVHRAVPLPEQEGRVLDLALLEPADLELRVPDPHVGLVEAEVVGGVAAQVLIGEEEQLLPASQGPRDDGPRVRRRAHGSAVAAD